VQVTDNEGQHPIHIACRYGCNFFTVEVLLEGNPELVRVSDNNGRTALHHACQYGHSGRTIAHLLEGNTDLVEMNDNKGRNILHAACDGGAPLGIVRGLVRRLSSTFPLLIPMLDNDERTILHAACGGGASLEVVRYLVDEVGCDITAVDSGGDLPLHKACVMGNAPVIEYLMAMDMAAVYARNNSNELPIHVLSNRSGKEDEVLESTEYTGAILNLLLAYPETADL
jgi:ankyrin repeat protein